MFKIFTAITACTVIALAAGPAFAQTVESVDSTARGGVKNALDLIEAEAAARAAADTSLQEQIDNIQLLPGPEGPPGPPGPPGAGGTNVIVVAQPDGADGNYVPGRTLYEAADVCGGSGVPLAAGVFDNPNTPGRISAGALDFDQFDPDVRFQVTRTDINAEDGDIINADVEFFVQCIEFSSVVVATGRPNSTTVFVTSQLFTGDLGGVAGADAICQAAADDPLSVVPPGFYRAWISTFASGGPTGRFDFRDGSYLLPDGTVLATDLSDLTDGTILHPIDLDEFGMRVSPAPIGPLVWTGTTTIGIPDPSAGFCTNWTDGTNLVFGSFGRTDQVDSLWSFAGVGFCDTLARLYCFQQL